MKVILTVGHQQILLPDESGVSTILKVLAKGVLVWDRTYDGVVQVRDDALEVGMKMVPAKVRFVDEHGRKVEKPKPLALTGRLLFLENGEGRAL